jgi:hypothetical protein
MIVGAQAKNALLEARQQPSKRVARDDVQRQESEAVAVRHDLQQQLHNSQQQTIEIAYRRAERDRLLMLLKTAQRTLQQHAQRLSQDQQAAHQLQLEIAAARQQHEQLKLSLQTAQDDTPSVEVLTHRPTPLAKTVFGRELHFRLLGGRIVYVPVDELVDQFKTEAKQQVWKLRDAPAITEVVGPVRDFRLKYTLVKETDRLNTRSGGFVSQEVVRLDHYTLVPVRDDLGEPLDVALQPNSQFRSLLGSCNPQTTTITIWVYPDSFDAFRRLKEELYPLGFLTAGRPLPAGQLISGSPNGTHSAVQ